MSCAKCGVQILPDTAARNDGLCVPCKKGTRQRIEDGRRWNVEHREWLKTDPFAKLWSSLVERVHKTKSGFNGLSEAEQLYFAVGLLEGEVYNGGFHQYFFNSSGSYYEVAVSGLMAIEAHQSLALLREAKEHLFPKQSVPTDTATRRTALPDQSAKLDELDSLFWKDPDGLPSRMEAFARKHGLVPTSPNPTVDSDARKNGARGSP